MYSNTRSLTVGEIMSSPVVTGRENENIQSIAIKMKKHDISGVVIVDNENTPLGLVTSADIVKKVAVKKSAFLFSKAKHAMSSALTITRERTLEEAARQMADHKVKNLCVVDGKDKLVGIITEDDITRNASYLIEVLNEMVRSGFTKTETTVEGVVE